MEKVEVGFKMGFFKCSCGNNYESLLYPDGSPNETHCGCANRKKQEGEVLNLFKQWTQDYTCRCGNLIKAIYTQITLNSKPVVFQTLCDDCLKVEEEKLKTEEMKLVEAGYRNFVKQKMDKWNSMCPTKYRNIDIVRLIRETSNEEAIERVINWKYGMQGIFAWGRTSLGKTCSMWHLLKRLYFDENREIMFFDSSLANYLNAIILKDGSEAYSVIEKIKRVEVLCLDEFSGKRELKGRFASELFDIVKYREEWGLPILATDNLNGAAISDKAENKDSIGDPIYSRLKRICDVVFFK